MSKIMFYERRNTRKMCVNFQPQEDIRGPDQKRDPSSSSPEMTDFAKKSTKGIRCKGCNYLEEEHAYNDTRKPWYDVKNWRSDLHLETVDFGKTGINRKIRSVFFNRKILDTVILYRLYRNGIHLKKSF